MSGDDWRDRVGDADAEVRRQALEARLRLEADRLAADLDRATVDLGRLRDQVEGLRREILARDATIAELQRRQAAGWRAVVRRAARRVPR